MVTLTREDLNKLIADAAKAQGGSGGGGSGGGGSGGSGGQGDDDPIAAKVKKDREAREKADADAKTIENSLAFTMGIGALVDKDASLLPKDMKEIIAAAEKLTYTNAAHKANAVKASIIKAFFAVESNMEGLTASQRHDLDEYLKLSQTGREEKAATVYANIFEPTLEMNRRLQKAIELQRGNNGIQTSSGTEANYREKMIAAAQKHYLGK